MERNSICAEVSCPVDVQLYPDATMLHRYRSRSARGRISSWLERAAHHDTPASACIRDLYFSGMVVDGGTEMMERG